MEILSYLGIVIGNADIKNDTGAHYLSDTAVGFMITYTMYLVYRYWFRKRGYL